MSTSNDDLWGRADAILDEALEQPAEQRVRFVEQRCGDDSALLELVQRLLQRVEGSSDFLETGELPGLVGADAEEADPALVGQVVDRYRVLEELGRGGMAVVYLAERADGQFEQRVALKVIKRGIDTDEVVRRFSRERQILAQTNHPNIARLLDGGATADGRPYFVMEHVSGQPIDHYCDERRMSIRERIQLFLRVAEAVAYAHRNLVVHRDIKPSNIMVADEGQVKLLDFGIASYLEESAGQLTRTQQRFMTPAYASPEQVSGHPVTTASDVYQLGLLLYRLLSGRNPYRTGSTTPDALRKAICEELPTRPSLSLTSRRVTTEEDSASDEIGYQRQTSAAALKRQLAGDLDNIVLMTLRKEPERRYATVSQLIEDLERYLEGRPVSARSDTLWYRTSKFVGRHQVASAFAVAGLGALVIFASTMAVQAKRIANERDRANREAATAEQVSEFLIDLFKVSNPSRSKGQEVTAREVLDRGGEKIESELADQPAVRAAMMDTIGRVYQNLGLYDTAKPFLQGALEQRQDLFGPVHPKVSTSLDHVAWLLETSGKYDEAEPLYRQALDQRRALFGDETEEVADSLNNLALLLHRRGELDEAEPIFREALALRRRLLGQEHVEVATSMSNLALVLIVKQEYEEADTLFSGALAMRRKLLGEDHPHVAIALDNLGRLKHSLGETDAAEEFIEQALELRRRILGPDHPDIAESLNNLAAMRFRRNDLAGAAEMFRQALEVGRRRLGPDHPDLAVSVGNLAFVLHRNGELEEAEPLYLEALRMLRASAGDEHWLVGQNLTNYGDCLMKMKRLSEAEGYLTDGQAVLEAALGADNSRTQEAIKRLVAAYEALGQPGEAQRWASRIVADEPSGG